MIGIINYIIQALGNTLGTLLDLLPNTPFTYILNIDHWLVDAINWAFPVEMAIAHISAFATAVGIYYIIRIPLRWLKAAGD